MTGLLISEAAQALNISRARLHQLIKQRGIQPEKIRLTGGKKFIYRLSMEQFDQLRERVTGRPKKTLDTSTAA